MRSRIDDAWQRANDCAQRAQDASTPEARDLLLRLRDTWIDVANRLQFIDAAEQNAKQP